MPDHAHFVFIGLNGHADQLPLIREFSREWNKLLHPVQLAIQAYDNVLREDDRANHGFPDLIHYILQNPVRKELVAQWQEWSDSGTILPGYPHLDVRNDDFWENFWKGWTLTGTDGAKVTGTGEGGIFRCNPDGSGLRRIAKGFWNPFGICVREDGEIFAGENDPGSRPPCRILHIVEGGDYGYNRRYGNAPVHPFVAWNGELRGTLPMLHASGEAPCGIQPLGGGLLAGSWTDNRIDFYPLKAKGASFETDRITGSALLRDDKVVHAEVHRAA